MKATMLTSERDPRGAGGEVRGIALDLEHGTIRLAFVKGQDYGPPSDSNLAAAFAATDGINWFHRTMSVELDAPTARWLATELNGLAAALKETSRTVETAQSVLREALESNQMGPGVWLAILDDRVQQVSPGFRAEEQAWVDRVRAALAREA